MTSAKLDWTDERKNQLREWATEGKSRGWIAMELRKSGVYCTRNMIVGQLWRLGIRSTQSQSELNKIAHETRRIKRARTERSNLTEDKHKSLVANITRVRAAPRRLPVFVGNAPKPLRVSAADLERFHCKSVVTGETGDRCEPLYCGHTVVDEGRPWCAYHKARYTRVERL